MNQVHTHPGQPEMQAEVILASFSQDEECPPLYTIRLRYPRIIHAEVMTHRAFSRNARSSRAVPVQTMLNEVRERPFVPWHWGRNQKGMQAAEECQQPVTIKDFFYAEQEEEDPSNNIFRKTSWAYSREGAWCAAAKQAVDHAEAFMDAGYHKQVVNRLLEPFTWIDVLVTATDWTNFLWLREHKDAEPHLQDLARLVRQAIEGAEYQILKPGEWHLPYVTDQECDKLCADLQHGLDLGFAPDEWEEVARRISAARCARISYKPFGASEPDIKADLKLYDKLVGSDRIHASPLEHQATPDGMITYGPRVSPPSGPNWLNPHLHGNLTGWIQYRKTIPGEAV